LYTGRGYKSRVQDKPFRREELFRWPLRKRAAAADQPPRFTCAADKRLFPRFDINLPAGMSAAAHIFWKDGILETSSAMLDDETRP